MKMVLSVDDVDLVNKRRAPHALQLWVDLPGVKDRISSDVTVVSDGSGPTAVKLSHAYSVPIGSAARDELVTALGSDENVIFYLIFPS